MTTSAQGYLRRQYLCVLRRCALLNVLATYAMLAIPAANAGAQSIVTDGRTQTQVRVNGAVTDISTQTVRGNNAFNSFSKFNVDAGKTVNFYLPGQTGNLLNLVYGEQSYINGLVNSFKDGHIGGNVFFFNPHGLIVGSSGVLNVGSLTLATPTAAYMNGLLSSSGAVDDSALAQALAGHVPLDPSGLVLVKGHIHANDAVTLTGGTVNVDSSAHIQAGGSAAIGFADLVNVQGAQQAAGVSVAGGVIRILAAQDINVAGQVTADGYGAGAAGGAVQILAGHNATLQDGGRVTADAGNSGNGGFVEFSALQDVTLHGNGLSAAGHGGTAGQILIDPTNLSWTGTADDHFTHGSNITIEASDTVLLDGVVVSTRDIGSATADTRSNHLNALSQGDSGDISISAKHIELKNGTQLLANANNGHNSGNITLSASDSASLPFFTTLDPSAASVNINASTIKGGNISISATANDVYTWLPDQQDGSVSSFFANIGNQALDFISSLRPLANYTYSKAHATVLIDGNSQINASGTLDVKASASTNASMHVISTLLGFGYGETDTLATVDIGAATLASVGNMTLSSEANSTLNVQVDTVNTGALNNTASDASKYANASIAVGMAKQVAQTTVASNAVIAHADTLSVTAGGTKSFTVASSAGSFKDGMASSGISVGISDTEFSASLGGNVTANQVSVNATVADASTQISASAGTGGSPDVAESITSGKTLNEIVFEKFSELVAAAPSMDSRSSGGSGGAGALGLAASFAWLDNSNQVKAEVASNAHIQTGQLDVRARAEDEVSVATSAAVDQREVGKQTSGDSKTAADKKKIALSASVAVTQMQNQADAEIGDGAVIQASGSVNLVATTSLSPTYAIWTQWADLYDQVKSMDWSSANAYADLALALKGVASDPVHANTWTQTAVESDKLAFAGAVNFYSLRNQARAHIGAASINANSTTPDAAQDVNVLARAEQRTLNLVGVPEFDPTSDVNNATSGVAGFGGSYLQFNLSGGSDASIAAGASVHADQVAVLAHTDMQVVELSETVGKAGKVSINGAFSLLHTDLHTIAQIGAGGTLVGRDVLVKALDDSWMLNAAGGVARSQAVGIGFSVALNELNSETLALIGNRNGESASGGSLTSSGDLLVQAERSGFTGAFAVAGSGPSSNESDEGKTGGDGSKKNSGDDGKQGKSGVGISGAAAVNIVNDSTHASINKLASVTVLGTRASSIGMDWDGDGAADETQSLAQGLGDKALNAVLDLAGAGSLTVATGKTAGLAGAFTWNELVKDTRADISDIAQMQVDGGGSIALFSQNSGDLWSISAGAAGGDKVGVAGSVAYSTVDNVAESTITAASDLRSSATLSVQAQDDSDIRSIAGAASYGGKAGLGAGVGISQVHSSTRAHIADASVLALDGVTIRASNNNAIFSLAAALGASSGVAVSGAVSYNVIGNQTEASSSNAQLSAPNHALTIQAQDSASILSIAGSVALSGQASVGIAAASNDISDSTEARASGGALSGSSLQIEASETATIGSYAAGASLSGQTALTGSLGINTIGNSTTAEALNASLTATSGSLNVKASDTSAIRSVTGAAAVGGNVAVGAAGSYNHIGSSVLAQVSGGSATASDVLVDAERAATLDVWAISGALSGRTGVAGSVAVNDTGGSTSARIGEGAQLHASGNGLVTAQTDDHIKSKAGGVAFGGSAGVAGGIALNDIHADTLAEVTGSSTRLTALGNGAATAVDNGTPSPDNLRGAAVIASSSDTVESYALSASGGGTAAVAATVSVAMLGGSTRAQLADGAQLNTGAGSAGSDQEARVAAYHQDALTSGTGGGAVGGTAGVGGAADTAIVSHTTAATVNNARMQARKAVTVDSASRSAITQAVFAVGGGSYAGLAGTVGVVMFKGTTQAQVVDSSLASQGALTVQATSATTVDLTAGALALSGIAGVGITAAVTLAEQNTSATVEGNSQLNARGTTSINADSSFTQTDYAYTAAAAGGVGIAGTVNVVVVKGSTEASVGGDVDINADASFSNASQDVNVTASDTTRISNKVGSLGVGTGAVSAGVGAVADVILIHNGAKAQVADGAHLSAGRDITVSANTVRDASSLATAMGGGLSAGIAGAASVISIGARPSGDASSNTSASVGQASSMASSSATGNQAGSQASASAARADTARAGINLNSDMASSTSSSAAANVGRAALQASRNISVNAHNSTNTDATAVGAAASGGFALGGGIAIAQVDDITTASLKASTQAGGNVSVTALDDQPDQSLLRTYAGGAGLAGLAASFALHEKSSTASAELGGTVNATGAVTVDASIVHNLRSEGVAGAAGVVGIGASISYVTERGSASATLDDSTQVSAQSLDVHGHAQTSSSADVLAAAGGLISGAGADAEVSDSSAASATLGNHVTLHTAAGLTQVRAETDPLALAHALGASVSASLSIGVSEAKSTVDTHTLASTGDYADITAADFSLSAQTKLRSNAKTADASATAGVGGLLVGLSATEADSTVSTSTQATLGNYATLHTSHDLAVLARNGTSASADVTGINAGALAVGSNLASTNSNSTTLARIGENATLVAGNLLNLDANSSDTLRANTVSGSGGLGSVVASKATTNATAHTDAVMAAVTASSNPASYTVQARRMQMTARSANNISATASSVNASVAGYSGARAVQNVDNFTHVTLGAGLQLSAQELVLHAENAATKPAVTSGYNVESGSGGLLDAAAANSSTHINNDASVSIGADDQVLVAIPHADGAIHPPEGVLDISAFNLVQASDSVRLDSGGAIAIAKSESMVYSQHNVADVSVGERALLLSDGEINLSARAQVELDANARSKTYGLAGASQGASVASVGADNSIHIGSAATVQSDAENVNLLAGTDGTTANQLSANADTRLWNYTAIPVDTNPDADASVIQHNLIDVAATGRVRAVKSVILNATEGTHNAHGYGEGTDAYRETLSAIGNFFGIDTSSLKITGGSSYDNSNNWNDPSSGVNVNGTAEAGIHHNQFLTLASDGHTVQKSEGVSYTLEDQVLLRDKLQAQIDALVARQTGLENAARDYAADSSQATSAADAAAGIGGDLAVLQAQLAAINTDTLVNFIHVNSITALTGDVRVSGRYLSGSGTLNAPGDVRIAIENNSTRFMTTNVLNIPDDQGGQVSFNGLGVSSGAAISARNQGGRGATYMVVQDADSSPKPVVSVLNTNSANSPTGLPAQLWMEGDVTNLRGTVTANSQGTLKVSGNVDAETINMATGGDFIKTYTTGFTHQGGDPVSQLGTLPANREAANVDYVQSTLATSCGANGLLCSSIIAGNNVYISGEKLNINGLIQAGLPDRAQNIDAILLDASNPENSGLSNTAAIAALRSRWQSGDHSQTLLELNRPLAGSSDIKVSYDAANDRLQLDNVRMGGGHLELYGNIFSTGNGQLNVMDGYGRINVNNSTAYDLAVGRVDTGAGVEGVIKITDTSRRVSNGVLTATGGVPLVTQISRLGDTIQTMDNATQDGSVSHLVSSSNGRTSSFATTANRRFNWINAKTTVTDEDRVYTTRVVLGASFSFLDSDPPDSVSTQPPVYTPRATGDWLSTVDPVTGPHGDYVMDYTIIRGTPFKYKSDTSDSYGVVCVLGACAYEEITSHKYFETVTNEYYQHSLDASKAIGIRFIGYDSASLNLNSVNSQLLLGGLVRAVNGNTTLNGKTGIQSLSDDAHIVANNLSLTSSAGAIGNTGHPLNIDLVDAASGLGRLTANGFAGVAVKEIDGDLRIAQVNSDNGDVNLIADHNLFADDPTASTATVTGNTIHLVALSGAIGDALNPLKMDTRGSTSTFSAEAAVDIHVAEQSGDLRVVQVKSAAGDVSLSTPGKLLDLNHAETVDTKTVTELNALWDQMALHGSAADDANNRNLQTQQLALKQAYEDYFRMRNLHLRDDGSFSADAYNPNYAYHLTANQSAALKAANGWNDSQVAAYEAGQTAAYKADFARFGATAYVANYAPTLSADETAALSAGHKWNDLQLANAIAAGLLKQTSDTNIRIEDANVIGRNITLQAGSSIGSDTGVVSIARNFGTLSDAEKLALLTAERSDLVLGADGITIAQHEDFNVTASGSLNASASNTIYLGSEQNLQLGLVQAAQQVRIKTAQGLSAVANQTNVAASNMVLEAGNGDMGSAATPIRVDSSPGNVRGTLTARAGGNLFVTETSGDMLIESVFARGDATLAAAGSILESQTNRSLDVRANSIRLTAGNSIGQGGTDQSLDVAVNSQGTLTADAPNGVYLNSTGGSGNLGDVHTGGRFDFSVDQGSMALAGSISADAGVSLSAADDLIFAGGQVRSLGDVSLRAGSDGSGSIFGAAASSTDVLAGGALSITAANDIGASQSLQVRANYQATLRGQNIDAEVSPLLAGAPLSVTVTGPVGDTALNTRLRLSGAGDVSLPSFISHNAEVRSDGPTLSVDQGYLGDAVTFYTPAFSVRVDHLVRSKTPGLDVRAFSLDNDFSLRLTPTSASVDDIIINQDLRRNIVGSVPGVAEVLSANSLQTLQRQLPLQGFTQPPVTPPAPAKPLVNLDQLSMADIPTPKP